MKRSYDFRLKNLIAKTKNPYLFPHLNIPRSTAKNWINRGVGEVVTHEAFDLNREDIELRCLNLEEQVRSLTAQVDLLKFTCTIRGLELQYRRFSEADKLKFLEKIKEGLKTITISKCLESIGISSQRYSHWIKRQKKCQLEDQSTCPKLSPQRISSPEIPVIKSAIKDPKFSHFRLTSLWHLLRNRGELVVSNSSWFRIIRELKLEREKRICHHIKPKLGVRADRPNQILHVDISVLIFNGFRAYLQVVRDNFSRFVLAYHVSEKYGAEYTSNLLKAALESGEKFGYFGTPKLYSDKGSENVNAEIHDLNCMNVINHILAQVDIHYSNSMIEALFHQLKNRYLYFKDIRHFNALLRHLEFYITEHNEIIPMAALGGATPLAAYKNPEVVIIDPAKERDMVDQALLNRMAFNQSLQCSVC